MIDTNYKVVTPLMGVKKVPFVILTVIAVLAVLSICGFASMPIYYAYFALAFYIVVGSKLGGRVKVYYSLVIFIAWAAMGIYFTSTPAIFHPWTRLAAFILILFCVSPLVITSKLYATRSALLFLALYAMLILAVASFVCYPLGINLMYREALGGYLEIYSGTFSGLFQHSMTLGPVAAISTVFALWCCFLRPSRRAKVIYGILAIASFLACILSASRGAVIACVVGCCVLFWMISRNHPGRMLKYMIVAACFSAVIFLNTDYADMLFEKQEVNLERGGTMFSSRDEKWGNRIAEFKSSPIFGVGFASISLDSSDAHYDVRGNTDNAFAQRGVVEPGTSILATLSMTGIVGFLLIWVNVIVLVVKAYRLRSPIANLLIALVCCQVVHSVSEGFIFAAGNYLCFFFWLTLGVIAGVINYTKPVYYGTQRV